MIVYSAFIGIPRDISLVSLVGQSWMLLAGLVVWVAACRTCCNGAYFPLVFQAGQNVPLAEEPKILQVRSQNTSTFS